MAFDLSSPPHCPEVTSGAAIHLLFGGSLYSGYETAFTSFFDRERSSDTYERSIFAENLGRNISQRQIQVTCTNPRMMANMLIIRRLYNKVGHGQPVVSAAEDNISVSFMGSPSAIFRSLSSGGWAELLRRIDRNTSDNSTNSSLNLAFVSLSDASLTVLDSWQFGCDLTIYVII